jgi:MSHA biogenesis protein MshN
VVAVAAGDIVDGQRRRLGVFQMSLINQMLQDLEQRSTGEMPGDAMQRQIRAVPERGGLHAAWWLVLLLSLLLAGTCLWFWLRPAPPAVAPPDLELKLAAGLSTVPQPLAQPRFPLDANQPPAPVPHALPENAPGAEREKPILKSTSHDSGVIEMPAEANLAATAPAKSSTKVEASPIANAGGEGTPKLDKQVKELTPQQRAENAYRAAGNALQQNRQSEAIADLEQALQLDARHAAARQMLVGLMLQAKRNDDAVHIAEEGLSGDPAQVGLAMILARVQVEQGKLRPALETLDLSLPYAIDRADYHAFLAALLQRDKRHKEAIDHYVVALGKAPQNGVWWMGLGISLQAENRLPEAREAFAHAKTSNSLTPELEAFVNQKLTELK